MKKIIESFLVILLVLFSFYYTEKAITLIEANDPIMKKIKSNSKQKENMAVDAKIDGNKLIPGYNGVSVDLETSFRKMKNYGSYNESLLVFEEVKPSISVDDYYDKYISSGNGFTTNIALVFTVDKNSYIEGIVDILNSMDVVSTFFIDGTVLDDKIDFVKVLHEKGHELEILSYDNKYDKSLFKVSLDKLISITNKKAKYCYADYDKMEVLELCSSLSFHTIIPTINLNNNLYGSIKGNLRSGSIIRVNLTKDNLMELKVLINYIKQRGFTLTTLDDLLNEARFEK